MLVVNLTEETFRLVFGLNDGTNIRVAEHWRGEALVRYSYYWLDTEDRLKVRWDNALHYPQLETFPHHKHIDGQENRVPSASGVALFPSLPSDRCEPLA